MAPRVIQEAMGATYWETDQDPVKKCIAFVRNVVNIVLGFLPYALSVRNRGRFITLRKLK